MKCILIETEDGAQWTIPLEVIAKHRAEYYAERDKDTTFGQEFVYVMEDDYEGVDWFQNNMNAEDYAGSLTLYKPAPKKTFEDMEVERIEIRDVPSVHDTTTQASGEENK